ncbi:oxidoreductase [Azospirillum sp. ST 5-10]|uniref:oxidoreductase n=1 Tax=unclassified Azospirillum TaxID=2630922 RepID=UPI003F49DCFF
MTDKVWLITGISRGLGLALAQAVLARGDAVVGTTRDGAAPPQLAPERLTVLPLDVADPAQVERAAAQAQAVHGRIDVLVNNAGYGLLGPVEAATATEVERLFAVNVFGPLNLMRAVLPHMRARRSGHIVNVSSIAAIAPAPGSGVYAATKGALWALSQSLAQEAAPLGIWVTVVSPGAFRTDFLSEHSLRHTATRIDAYAESARVVGGLMERAGRQPGDPAKAAQAIVQAVQADEPPFDLLLGSDALARARVRLDRLDDDLGRWESVGRATDVAP